MSIQQKKIRIAIVGGGPAGVSCFLHLKNSFMHVALAEHIELFIFEKGETLGAGMPYASLDSAHLLNLSKVLMEPVSGEQCVFSQWLSYHDSTLDNSAFPPRHYFGKYLVFRVNQAKSECEKKGMKINVFTLCPVLSIQQIGCDLFEIKTENKQYQVHYVILSTGHMPASNFSHLIGKPGYIHNPWDLERYKCIHPQASVGIIGSRLTAIDVALSLKTRRHQGKIEMISRGGLLPAVKGMPCSYSPQFLNMFNLKQGPSPVTLRLLLQLFWQEMNAAGQCTELYYKKSAIDWINREIHEVQSAPRAWQAILSCFYQLISRVWSQLSLEDREQFLTHYFSLFASYNCAFPFESALSLRQMMVDGQIEVHAGFRGVQFEDSQFVFELEHNKTIKSSVVFNATGCGHDPEKHPLLKSMLEGKLLAKHPLGGINAEPSTLRVIDASSVVNQGIYALGDVVGGVCFYTIEMTHMVQQAKRLTEHLVREVVGHMMTRKCSSKGVH